MFPQTAEENCQEGKETYNVQKKRELLIGKSPREGRWEGMSGQNTLLKRRNTPLI